MRRRACLLLFLGLIFFPLFFAPGFLRAGETFSASTITESLEGDIIAVNTDNKTIEVRWMVDTTLIRYQNITLRVLPATALIKNARTIEFSDIEAGDHATIRYAPNTVPLAEALSIDIEE